MDKDKKENDNCELCRFYNVGCHWMTKERKYKIYGKKRIPDCYKNSKATIIKMEGSMNKKDIK